MGTVMIGIRFNALYYAETRDAPSTIAKKLLVGRSARKVQTPVKPSSLVHTWHCRQSVSFLAIDWSFVPFVASCYVTVLNAEEENCTAAMYGRIIRETT